MSADASIMLVLGDGPVARALEVIFRVERIGRREDDCGWDWPCAADRLPAAVERAQLIVVAGEQAGVARWIRWHADTRGCPLARRVGCALFGLADGLAAELGLRDVMGRIECHDEATSFASWGDDLAILGADTSLPTLTECIAGLWTLPKSGWDRLSTAAHSEGVILEAIAKQDLGSLQEIISSQQVDWDARCFPIPEYGGNAHHWAGRIQKWLSGVTAGVTPNWEEGLALFSPFAHRSN